MQLKYCAMTGADDAVDSNDLVALGREFPFVEWAILWMPERAGTRRFPTMGWIENFKKTCKDSHTSLHLCGRAFLDFADGRKGTGMDGFKRIQLNLQFDNAGNKCDLAKLAAQVKAHPDVQFILQYTPDKKETLLPLFKDISNHALLFDASAGTGTSPEKWDPPVEGHACGYAGGLGPDNIGENLKMLARILPAGYTTWIDMESKVRTDDAFDLKKVRRVLESVKNFSPPEKI